MQVPSPGIKPVTFYIRDESGDNKLYIMTTVISKDVKRELGTYQVVGSLTLSYVDITRSQTGRVKTPSYIRLPLMSCLFKYYIAHRQLIVLFKGMLPAIAFPEQKGFCVRIQYNFIACSRLTLYYLVYSFLIQFSFQLLNINSTNARDFVFIVCNNLSCVKKTDFKNTES